MTLWKKNVTLDEVNKRGENTLVQSLGIRITELGEQHITGTMPVDERTCQPLGIVHGGASVALAETLGSIAANMVVDDQHYCVGLEINANHTARASEGYVVGTAKPIHLGRKTQVWEIHIRRQQDQKLTCISRLTIAVVEK